MEHLLNYFNHRIFDASYYHRQFDRDVIEQDEDSEAMSAAKRAFLVSVPFLSMYKPLGNAISTSSGTFRIASHINSLFSTDSAESLFYEGAQTSLAIAALAGNYFNFTLGLYVTSAVDITTNITNIISHLQAGRNEEAFEQFLQIVGSSLYLAIMMSGSLEATMASLLVQGITNAYQARKEWNNDRIPEFLAKTAMGLLKVHQAGQQIPLIQRKNYLYSLEKYKNLIASLNNGKRVNHLINHPLAGLAYQIDPNNTLHAAHGNTLAGGIHPQVGDNTEHIVNHPLADLDHQIKENNTTFFDKDGKEYDFGAHFHGNGKGLVKGMNICFKDKKDYTQLDFKVNHVHRDRLQKVIDEIESYANNEELKDLLFLSKSHVKNISFKEIEMNFEEHGATNLGYEITFEGLGKIFIGATTDNYNQYDRVSLHMEKGKNLFDFHEILSFMNLDDALRQSAIKDVERMKLGYLFRIFCPKEATLFERTDQFFDLPIDELKNMIIKKAPSMEGAFEKYLPRLELREILPGKMRFAINGLADELRQLGGYGLTALITGPYWDESDSFNRVDMILRMGMLSSETRYSNGITASGLSPTSDFYTGGGDSVYMQFVTKGTNSFDEFFYNGSIRILYPLEALEMGTYQYHYDSFGYRRIDGQGWWWDSTKYLDRPNIFEFVEEEARWPTEDEGIWGTWAEYGGNEIMIKERISMPPSGLVVNTENTKKDLIEYLRKTGICKKNEKGIDTILGKAAHDFIHVGDQIKEALFN